MRLPFVHIPSGREGFVYLIHAEGTNRYKIGRSTSPLQRYQVLQKQSPYPLKVVKCFYSFDAKTDEVKLHEEFAPIRIYGEWFEVKDKLGKYSFYALEERFFSYTSNFIIQKVAESFTSVGFVDIGNLRHPLIQLAEFTLDKQKCNRFWKIIEKALEYTKTCDLETIEEFTLAFLYGATETLSILEEV